jgi:hypothetical protein
MNRVIVSIALIMKADSKNDAPDYSYPIRENKKG